jgi:hypothetical protein
MGAIPPPGEGVSSALVPAFVGENTRNAKGFAPFVSAISLVAAKAESGSRDDKIGSW